MAMAGQVGDDSCEVRPCCPFIPLWVHLLPGSLNQFELHNFISHSLSGDFDH